MARMIRWAILAALAAGAAPAPAQVGTWTIRGTGTGTGVSWSERSVQPNRVRHPPRESQESAREPPARLCRGPGRASRSLTPSSPATAARERSRRSATRLPPVPHSEKHVPPAGADFPWHHRCSRWCSGGDDAPANPRGSRAVDATPALAHRAVEGDVGEGDVGAGGPGPRTRQYGRAPGVTGRVRIRRNAA